MIFISVGTQKFQFNRLLKMIDDLIDEGVINDECFAQIGYSTYKPKNYFFCTFLSQYEFENKIKDADIYITHAGVGSIHCGLSNNKKTIIVPRLCEFGEHVDDHQLDIAKKYDELEYCRVANDFVGLKKEINNISTFSSKFRKTRKSLKIVERIREFLEKE